MLYFTIGLPRCGKTTFGQRWKEQAPNRIVVNTDKIRLSLYGQRYNHSMERYVKAIECTMVKTLLMDGFDVLLDESRTNWHHIKEVLYMDTNPTPIWFPVCPSPNNLIQSIEMQATGWLEHVNACKSVALATNQPDLIPVIERRAKEMEKLSRRFTHKFDELRKEFLHANPN